MHSHRFGFTIFVFALLLVSAIALLDSPAPSLAQNVGPSPTTSVEPSVSATIPTTVTATATSTPTSRDIHLSLVQNPPLPTATPTATPIPACNAYFDDFSDPNSGWGSRDHPVYSRGYIGGEYQIMVKQPEYIIFVASPAPAHAVYDIAADLRWNGQVGFTYGLLFGVTQDGAFYLFEVDSLTQRYAISYWPADPNQPPELITSGESAAINTNNAINNLAIATNGSAQSYFINDHLVASSNVAMPGMRYTGISASSYDTGNVDTRFDNYCLTTLSGAESLEGRQSAPTIEPRAFESMLSR